MVAQQPFLTVKTTGGLRSNYNGFVGAIITLPSAISVYSLGRRCSTGNSLAHTVEIVDASTNTVVASASVAMKGCTLGKDQFQALPMPISLAAGTYYLASQENNGGDQWADYPGTSVTPALGTIPGVVYTKASPGFVPVTVPSPNTAYVPVNFTYTMTAPPVPVPPTPPVPPTASGIAIQLDGVPQGTSSTLDFPPGTGIQMTCSQTASAIHCSPSYNQAVIPTHDSLHANELYCKSTNGTTVYTCKMHNRPISAYTEGMVFLVEVDTTCASTCSLNVDGLGAKTIWQANGSTSPNGKLVAGQAQWVWIDNAINLRLMY